MPNIDEATVASFGPEWLDFDQWLPSGDPGVQESEELMLLAALLVAAGLAVGLGVIWLLLHADLWTFSDSQDDHCGYRGGRSDGL